MGLFNAGDLVKTPGGYVLNVLGYHPEHQFLVIGESLATKQKECYLESGLKKINEARKISIGDKIELEVVANVVGEDHELNCYLVELHSITGMHIQTGWISADGLSEAAVSLN